VAAGAGTRDGLRVSASFVDPPADLEAKLAALGVSLERRDGDEVVLTAGTGEDDSALLAKLIGAGLKVRAFQPATRTLEDAYLAEVRS
jgi:hypothetical protein